MNLPALIGQIQVLVGAEPDKKFGVETAQRVLERLTGATKQPVTNRAVASDLTDARSEKIFATLQPHVIPYMRALIHSAADSGIVLKALSGTRTYAEQEEIFKRGASRAHGGHSNHNFGIACDFGIFINGKYLDNEVEEHRITSRTMDAMYSTVGQIGKSLGLEWGGDWKSFVDMPHFQLRPVWAKDLSEAFMLAQLRDRKAKGKSFV